MKDLNKKTADNGKGSAPRNLSEKFRANYADINWKNKTNKEGGKNQ